MSFTNNSLPLLRSIRNILLDLGYVPLKISINNLYLTRRHNLINYASQIGFGNPKHLERARRFGITD